MSGYVLIHRKLLSNKVFRNKTEAWAFADLVMQAAWQTTTAHYKGRNIVLERGQLCISVRDFAAQWGRSNSWSQRFFDRLFEAKMLIQNRYTTDTPRDTPPNVITICNYDKYQAVKGKADTASDARPIQNRYTEQGSNEGMKVEPEGSTGGRKRPTRLKDDWLPIPLTGKAAEIVAAWPIGMLERELEKFRNYWSAKGGQQAAKIDWQKTWVNWIYTADERRPRNERDSGGPEGLARKYREERERERTTH